MKLYAAAEYPSPHPDLAHTEHCHPAHIPCGVMAHGRSTPVCQIWDTSNPMQCSMSTKGGLNLFVLFGPYSQFTTWATLASHPDATLPRTRHVCQKKAHICFWIFGASLLFYKQASSGSHAFCAGHKKNRRAAQLPELPIIIISFHIIWTMK